MCDRPTLPISEGCVQGSQPTVLRLSYSGDLRNRQVVAWDHMPLGGSSCSAGRDLELMLREVQAAGLWQGTVRWMELHLLLRMGADSIT